MRDEIRERIEAVRRGEVPEGYVVENHQLRPVDWGYDKIGKHLIEYDEYSNDTECYPLTTSSRQGLMLQSEYYGDQRYVETAGGFHIVPEGYITYRHMSDDDVFKFNVNNMGTPVLVSPEYPVFTTDGDLNKTILIEYLNGMKEFRAFCSAQKKGSTRTRMYFGRLGEFSMPIPTAAEQRRITEILDTCDRIIQKKQELIEEKGEQKRWLMEKLLSPRDENDSVNAWETRTFQEVCQFINGRAYKQEELLERGKYPVLRVGNLFTKDDWYYSDLELPERQYIEDGDLIYAWSASFGPQIWRGEKVIYHYHIWKVMPADVILKEYLYQYFQYDVQLLAKEQQGGTMSHVTKETMEKRTCRFPSIERQRIIARVLAKADQSIELSEQELSCWIEKKTALMQLLLTGLVRVNA